MTSSPIEEDDTLEDALPLGTTHTSEEAGPGKTEEPLEDTASEVPAVGLPRRRSRGLDHDSVVELSIVDGRYTFSYKFPQLYFRVN